MWVNDSQIEKSNPDSPVLIPEKDTRKGKSGSDRIEEEGEGMEAVYFPSWIEKKM